MPHTYEGLADITLSATLMGIAPVEILSTEVPVVLRSAGPNVVQMEFPAELAAPENANTVRLVLPSGKVLGGTIQHGALTGPTGWLTFNVETLEGLPG